MALGRKKTNVDLTPFPAAADTSKGIGIFALGVPLLALIVMLFFLKRTGIALGIVVFLGVTVLGVNLVMAFHDPMVLSAMCGTLTELSAEQRNEIVRTFMHGRPIGRGDMEGAAAAVGRLREAELALHNGKLSKKAYAEEKDRLLREYAVRDAAKKKQKS